MKNMREPSRLIRRFHPRIWLLLIVFAVGLFAQVVVTKAIDVISIEPGDWSCAEGFIYVNVVLNFTGGGEPEPNREKFGYRVTDGDGDVLVSSGFNLTWTPGTVPAPTDLSLFLNEVPTQNPVTIEIVDWDINSVPTGATWSVEAISPCAAPPNLPTYTPTATNTPANTPSPDDPFDVISIEPLDWSCAEGFIYVNVVLNFTGGGEPEPNREKFGYRVTDGDGDVLVSSGFNLTWTPGTVPAPTDLSLFLNEVPTQNPVTIEIVDWDINSVPTGATWSVEAISPCAPPPVTPTYTPTATSTPTSTPTDTPTPTPTDTPTATSTFTPTDTPTLTPTNTPTATFTNTPTPASPGVTPLSVCWVQHWNGTGSTEWRITNPNPVPIASVPDTKVRYNWSAFNQPNAQGNVVQSAQGWDNANPNPVNIAYTQSIRLEWYLVTNGTPSAILGTAIANADAGGHC